MSTGGRRGAEKPTFGVEMSRFEFVFEFEFESRRRHVDRSMRGPIWSDLGHPGLPDLVASTLMDASNSHADGRADKPSDSRLAVSISNSNLNSNSNVTSVT
jgi:hypothetical protein